MKSRLLIVCGVAASLMLSCTAAVRYSDKPGIEPYRPERAEEEPDQSATASDKNTDEDKDRYASRDTQRVKQRPRHNEDTVVDRERMNRIVANYLGTPYSLGGTGRMGIDCSGLMYVLYRDYDGTRLPISTEALYRLDNRVNYDNLQYGDLIFFRLGGRKVSHVGMYLENAKFVHASESRGVTVDELTTEYYATSYAGARRIH